jgi:hypothetical protein
MITIAATRLQSLVNRVAKTGYHMLLLAFAAWGVTQLVPVLHATLLLEAAFVGTGAVLLWLWLLAFNSGKMALPEAEVRWDATGLRYVHYDEVTELLWADFRDSQLTWDIPRRLRIRRTQGGPLYIEVFAFPKAQRMLLLEELAARRALPNQRMKLASRGGRGGVQS